MKYVPNMAAQPSTAFRFNDRTKSNGGGDGADALWRACKDCKQTVKQVQEPPPTPPFDGAVDLGRVDGGRTPGTGVGVVVVVVVEIVVAAGLEVK